MKKAPKNKFGQYFTPAPVAEFMVGLTSVSKEAEVLEPCCGEGIFLDQLGKKGFTHITAYEIDRELASRQAKAVICESFVTAGPGKQFDLIIGNPPYIRWKYLEEELKNELKQQPLWNHYFNSLCDYLYIFILKSIELLKENGELIFICPEYWMNTTHSQTLRDYMMTHGYFEKIYHFKETPVFDKVSVSIVIFKYIKQQNHNSPTIYLAKYEGTQKLTTAFLHTLEENNPIPGLTYFTISQFRPGQRWILASEETKEELDRFETACRIQKEGAGSLSFQRLGDICEIGNGMVSGLDKAFQLNGQILNEREESSTIRVVKARDLKPFYHEKITRYIFPGENVDEGQLKTGFPAFYEQLIQHKTTLLSRYNYNRDIKYWEWVFLRNFNLFRKNEPRIFVPCKERISHKDHFRFALAEAGIFPTQDVTAIFKKEKTRESIYYILALLNNHRVFHWLRYNGIVKGNIVEFSEKPLAAIPIRLIDWEKEEEVEWHDAITALCQKYIETRDPAILCKMAEIIERLFHNYPAINPIKKPASAG